MYFCYTTFSLIWWILLENHNNINKERCNKKVEVTIFFSQMRELLEDAKSETENLRKKVRLQIT